MQLTHPLYNESALMCNEHSSFFFNLLFIFKCVEFSTLRDYNFYL